MAKNKERYMQGPEVAKAPRANANLSIPTTPQYPLVELPKVTSAALYDYIPKPLDSNYFNYNDPYEINSMADVILTTFNKDMKRGDWGGLENIPILNVLTGTADLMNNSTLKPLMKGDFKAVALNNLINLGETMDIVANPVKGAIFGGTQGFKDSLGLGNNGRQNFDYDTGNLGSDIALEMLSDPLNWVSLGGWGVAKAGVGAVVDGVTEVAQKGAKVAAKNVSEEMYKTLAKKATSSFLRGEYDSMDSALRTMANHYADSGKMIFKRIPNTEDFKEVMKTIAGASTEYQTSTLLKGVQKLTKPVEMFEQTLLKATATSSGLYPVYKVGKSGMDWATQSIHSRMLKAQEPYTIQQASGDRTLNIFHYDDIQNVFDSHAVSYNLASKYIGDESITPEVIHTMFNKSITADFKYIDNAIKENKGDPEAVNEALKMYFSINSDDVLATYLEQVKKINARTDNMYDDIVNLLEEQVRFFNDIKEQNLVDTQIKNLNLEQKAVEHANVLLKDIHNGFKSGNIQNRINTIVDTAEAKIRQDTQYILKNLAQANEGKLTRFQMEEYQKIMKGFNSDLYLKYITDEVNKIITDMERKLNAILNANFDKTFYDAYLTEHEKTFKYAFEYFERIKKHISSGYFKNQIESLINGDTSIWLRIPPMKYKISDFSDDVLNNALDELIKRMPSGDMKEIVSSQYDLGKLLDKAKGQGNIINALRTWNDDVKAKALNSNKVLDTQTVKKVEQFKGDIQRIFGDDTVKFVTDNKALFVSSPDVVAQAVDEFINVDINNIDLYTSAWYDLNRVLTVNVNSVTKQVNSALSSKDGVRKVLRQDIVDLEKKIKMYDEARKEIYGRITFSEATRDVNKDWLVAEKTGIPPGEIKKLRTQLAEAKKQSRTNVDTTLAEKLSGHTKTISALEELTQKLNSIQPDEIIQGTLDVLSTGIVRQLKLEQTYTLLELMNIQTMNSLMEQMSVNTGTGKLINNLTELNVEATNPLFGMVELATRVRSYVEHFGNAKRFLDRVSASGVPDDVKWAFMSTVQKIANTAPEMLAGNFDYYFKKIITQTEEYLYTKQMPKALNITALLDDNGEELRKLVDAKIGANHKQHDALYDVYATEEIINKHLPDKFVNPDVDYYIFDIETTGLNSGQGVVFDIGLKQLGADGTQFKTALKPEGLMVPSTNALDTFFEGSTLTEAEKLNEFFRMHKEGGTEAETLYGLINVLKDAKATGRKVELIGHNSDKFDNDFIIDRMQKLGIPSKDIGLFKTTIKHDTYKMLNVKNGYYSITAKEKAVLNDNLTALIEGQIQCNSEKLIAPNNGALASDLKQLASDMHDMVNGKLKATNDLGQQVTIGDVQSLNAVATDIFETLNSIKKMNTSLQFDLIHPEYITDGRYLDKMKEFITENFAPDKADELLKMYGDYLNPTKLMYGALDDGVNMFGYKNAVDFNLLKEWINIPEDVIKLKDAKRYTSLAKRFEKIKNAIINPNYILQFEKEFKEILEYLLNPSFNIMDINSLISPGTIVNKFLQNIRGDKADVLSNYVIVDYLYQHMNSSAVKGIYKDDMHIFSDNLKAFLGNGEAKAKLFKREYSEEIINYTKKRTASTIDSSIVDVQSLRVVTKEFKETYSKNAFDKLAAGLDKKDLFLAKHQVIAAALEKPADMLEAYTERMAKLDVNEQLKYLTEVRNYTNNLARQQLINVLSLNDDNLFRLLVHTGPWTEFDARDLAPEMLSQLLSRKGLLKEKHMLLTIEGNRIYISLDSSVKIRSDYFDDLGEYKYYVGNEIIPKPEIPELNLYAEDFADKDLLKHFEEVRNSLHYLSRDASVGALGDVMSSYRMKDLYKALPDSVKNNMIDMEFYTGSNASFFKDNKYNFTNIGSIQFRKSKELYTTSNYVDMLKNTSEHTSTMAQTRLKYMSLYFSPEYSINNGWLSDSKHNKDLINALKDNPEFVLTALVKDKKYGCKAVRINPKSEKALEEARRLNAVIVPSHTYSKIREVINADIMKETSLKWWNRIIYTYKAGYLMDPGVVLRNYVDSTLKNIIDTGEFNEVFKTQAEAMVVLNDYNNIIRDVIRMNAQGRFTKEGLEFYFKNCNPKMDMEFFKLIDGFIKDGPSAGMTEVWQKYYMDGKIPKGLADELWGSFVHTSSAILKPNTVVEQVQRLTEYLMLMRRGASNTEAFYKVSKTHFDYSMKSDAERLIELVIPFYTFTMKNLEYWIDAVDKHPWVARQIDNFMEPVWNLDSYNQREYEANRSLQYQILSGNLPLTENGMTLKLSPSFMDAYNNLVNPVESFEGKLFSPITQLPKVENIKDVVAQLPFGNLIQKYTETNQTYFDRTDNPLNIIAPGVFGATKRWDRGRRTAYPRKQYIKKSKKRSGIRKKYNFKKYFVGKNYHRSFTPKKYLSTSFLPSKNYGSPSSAYYSNRINNKSFYNDHYTKKGNSRLKNRMTPVTAYTLRYRIQDFR